MARTVAVKAYAIAATIQPRDIEPIFGDGAKRVKLTKTQVIVRWDKGGYGIAHDFGAVVFVDAPPDRCEAVMKALLARVPPEPQPPLVEELSIEIEPGASPRASFDNVRAPELTPELAEVVALVLAQSVGIDYYDDDVDKLYRAIERRAEALAESGRFRGSQRELLKFIGQAMSTRNQVVFTLSLLDAPPVIWDDEPLDRLYRQLRNSFEIEDRFRSIDHKIGVIHDNLELLVDLGRHRRTVALEVMVVVLIAFEIVWSLFRGMTGH
jgi:uncharacterized Rmd1/YagE family protein